MKIAEQRLEEAYHDFCAFVLVMDGKPFERFAANAYLEKKEHYKYTVFKEARKKLLTQFWNQKDVGTGKIQAEVNSAIQTSVIHNFEKHENNLVDWRKKDDFSKLRNSKALEQLFYDFYKNKRKDSECFEALNKEGLSYQFIAYLFFIKDFKVYMPISQQRFDDIFHVLGVKEFVSSGNISWENYQIFLKLLKQTRDFLKTKDKATTLLDAHTFLWVVGTIYLKNDTKQKDQDQRKNPANHPEETSGEEEKDGKKTFKSQEPIYVASTASELKTEEWEAILTNQELTNEFDISIFQALYCFEGCRAYASQVALLLGMTHPPLNLEIGRYAKRIAEKYDVQFTDYDEGYSYWDLFFKGYHEGNKFVWELRPALKEALEKTGLTGEEPGAEEFRLKHHESIYEGAQKKVTINAYERNPRARAMCIGYWKAICCVCGFDFESVYGAPGKGFIHVHHLTAVSQMGNDYQVNPIEDLRPVCPNCHAMLHRKEPPYGIEDVKNMIEEKKSMKIRWPNGDIHYI